MLPNEPRAAHTIVSRLIKNNDKIVNKTFLQFMEQLGYDVELVYVKRDGINTTDARKNE